MRAEREAVAEPVILRGIVSMTEQFAERQKVRNCHGAGGSGHVELPVRHH